MILYYELTGTYYTRAAVGHPSSADELELDDNKYIATASAAELSLDENIYISQ
jgi:hypothetical protein